MAEAAPPNAIKNRINALDVSSYVFRLVYSVTQKQHLNN